jgi:hypothetical protein
MFHGGFMNTNDAYVKVEGIIRDNEGITKMGIIREAWRVGIGERMTRRIVRDMERTGKINLRMASFGKYALRKQ